MALVLSSGIRKGIERTIAVPDASKKPDHLESGKELKAISQRCPHFPNSLSTGIRKGIESEDNG